MENKLSIALHELQSKTIGLMMVHGKIELVIEDDEMVKTISIGSLGGLSTNHYSINHLNYIKFPDKYKNLSEFLNEPFEFNEWYNINFK